VLRHLQRLPGPHAAAALSLIALAALAIDVRYLRIVPAFENSDEASHLGFLVHLVQSGSLPRVEPGGRGLAKQEAIQTPLYYLSAVPFASSARGAALQPPAFDRSFRFAPAFPGAGPHRYYLDAAQGPPRVRALAQLCRRLRFVSVLWGLLASLVAAAFLLRLARGDVAHAALALALFVLNPRFVESCASFGNDIACVALATAALLLAVLTVERPRAPGWLDGCALGALCGLAALAKLSGLATLAFAVPALAWARGTRRGRLGATLSLLATTGILLLPWLVRNLRLYGDPLALGPELVAPFVSVRSAPFGPLDFFREEFQGLRWSYWAVFGQFAVLADPWVYPVLDALLLCGAVLAIPFFVQSLRTGPDRQAAAARALPAGFIVAMLAALLWHTTRVFGSQGRLLFPAGAALAWLLAGGLLLPFPVRARPWASAAGVAVMAVFAIYVGWSVLPRAYP
jgi:Dolichyl-phosphate-mannose-protein mannosyltransferase